MERYYPFEHKEESKKANTAAEEKVSGSNVAGKGRRDGNSRASVVVHSGNVTERAKAINERIERENDPDTYYRNRRESYRKDSSDSGKGSYGGKSYGNAGGYHKKDSGKSDKRFDAENDLRGKRLKLKVQENTDYGAFLETGDGKRILLPFAEMTERPSAGDTVNVTIYEDKGGRLTATMREPLIRSGETGTMTVAAVTKIGVFADNGMPKQVLIPFREMLHTPEVGDQILVHLYKDKSGREAGTMRVYRHLQKESGYKVDDRVEAFVYEINPEIGVFAAVDDKYYGMIPIREVFEDLHYGDRIEARVSKVREDGKLDLLMREKLYQAVDKDAQLILDEIKLQGGTLPYADRADSELIRKKFNMSKNQFKRALGWLYKKRLVKIDRETDTVTALGQKK